MEFAVTNNNDLEVPKKSTNLVKAIVLEAPAFKIDETLESGTKQIPEDMFEALISENKIIEPPFNPFVLATLAEYNTELGPCLNTMETNIDGFGHRLIPRISMSKADHALKNKVTAERVRLENFFLYAGMNLSFRELRRKLRRDVEGIGNGYWEVIRGVDGGVQYFEPIRGYQVRLTAQDSEAIPVDIPIIMVQEDGLTLSIEKIKVYKRFRRYVQVTTVTHGISTVAGYKQVWFKQFGDPRVVDKDTGEYVSKEQQLNWGGSNNPMPESQKANEVIHWRINDTRSPYGLPRFIGALIDIYGDRKASEINYVTFCNNNIPSFIVAVSNGQLTEDTVSRIKDFLEKLQGNDNRSKALIIEAEPIGLDEELEDSGNIKIDVKPLTKEQISDAQFLQYSKDNREKVRVAFRLPPILVGRAEDYTRTTAETSRRLADEQVFAPERDNFDDWVNRILFPAMGVIYHQYKSNSPNTTDNTELVKILAGAEKTGGMTPRIARQVLSDILSSELPDFTDEFDPDVPFSLTMAEAVKNQADPTEPGQQVTALKRLETITDLLDNEVGGGVIVDTLLSLRKRLEEEWTKQLFSEE